jgi:hypothetical protein
MLVPYLHLSGEDRIRILGEELREGSETWATMPTKIDGHDAVVLVCRKWGIIVVNGRIMALPQYPLQQLHGIDTQPTREDARSTRGAE